MAWRVRGICIAATLLLSASAVAQAPLELYLLHCAGCHRPHGLGAGPDVPSLHDSLGRLVQVSGGRAYLVQVPGVAQSPATDAELRDILNWVLHRFNGGTLPPDFSEFTLAEVRDARAVALPDPARQRAVLWQQVVHAGAAMPNMR